MTASYFPLIQKTLAYSGRAQGWIESADGRMKPRHLEAQNLPNTPVFAGGPGRGSLTARPSAEGRGANSEIDDHERPCLRVPKWISAAWSRRNIRNRLVGPSFRLQREERRPSATRRWSGIDTSTR